MKSKKNKKGQSGFIVAIDGPAGAGKSTVSRKLAEELGGRLLDTGAMYRGVAYMAIKARVKTEPAFAKIARTLKFDLCPKSGVILINGEDLGARLRSEKVSLMASHVSQYREVRRVLTLRQRSLAKRAAKKIPIVVEGRDIGTVVFPNVRFKFFVTASEEIRARRRFEQLKHQGVKGITVRSILAKHQDRDEQDSTREHAPLKCPKDAVVVDTSHLAISQVVQFMQTHIEAQLKGLVRVL